MTKAPNSPAFSRIVGILPNVKAELTGCGKVIEHHIREIAHICPAIRLLQYIIMPDHVHMLIFVTEKTEKALGSYIAALKVRIGQNLGRGSIFLPDFYDRILYKKHSLDVIFKYIKLNPYRLAVRIANPEFFQCTHCLNIGGTPHDAYGNLQLIDNPFKAQVVVHRADSLEVKQRKRDFWLHLAANGGVLVSPFISKEEKAIRQEAEALGGKVILITDRKYGSREKPAAHDFEQCAQGKLLIISADVGDFSRAACLAMNALAHNLATSGEH